MTEIGKPFGFFKPALEVEPAFSCSFSTPTRTSLRRATTSFSPFLQLPFELRAQITRISIRDAAGDLYEWSGTGGDPVVLQSRRGILRVQTQQKQPPSLAQLACVSKEWQDEIEKRLFETLSLTIRPNCKPGECSDIVKFASIVTGPRRRYLSGLQLDFCREYQTYQTSDSDFYRTGGGYRCFIRLLRILGTWGREQVADRLLMVELQIELYDSPLLPLMKKIRSLPTIPIIGELVITTDLGKFRNMPLALLYLFRKLPELRSADLYLSRWCSSRETDKNYKLEVLMERLHSATPKLKQLRLMLPSLYQQPGWYRVLAHVLTGAPVLSIRDLSHRLQSLMLDSPMDLSLFFKYFHNEVVDVEIMCSSWPDLQYLKLQGSIVKGKDPMSQLKKDWFLKVVGRAARRMPKLQRALIEIETESEPSSQLDDVDRMVITFEQNPDLGKCERPRLSVGRHTPSLSAVNIWKDTLQRTKGLKLTIEYEPAPYLDANGVQRLGEWQVWKEY